MQCSPCGQGDDGPQPGDFTSTHPSRPAFPSKPDGHSHVKCPGSFLQTAPLPHGLLLHSFMSEQPRILVGFPSNPFSHKHLACPLISLHSAFWPH